MDAGEEPVLPGESGAALYRWMGPSILDEVERVVRAADADGCEPIREADERQIMREMRRMGAVMGGVGALLTGRMKGEEGLQIFARMCADYIAADPALREALRDSLTRSSRVTRDILIELLDLASAPGA